MPVQLKPPTGLPTASSTAEDDAWSTLLSTQLDDVRKSAENWRTGLVAMVGVIVAFSVIKGPNDVSGLDDLAAYAVGLLLLMALVCASFGAWWSLAAAYGTPSLITRDSFRNEGGIDGYRLTLAMKAAAKLHCAKIATIVTLASLTIAVGLTWYGPRSKSVILNVERRSLPNVCGRLLSSSNGYIDIKPSASESIRLYMADLVKVNPVEKCS